uniref:Uncharacterized protein n=1 Tax=Lessardia elongata TaxID=210733 RepID=A0A7S2VWM2_9DINO
MELTRITNENRKPNDATSKANATTRSLLCSFRLLLTSDLLFSVLGILLCAASNLTLGACDLGSNQTVFRLEFLHLFLVVVHEAEACATAATKCGLKAKQLNGLIVMFVHLCELLCQVLFGDVRQIGVDHFNDKLLPSEQGIILEFACPHHERVRHGFG